MTGQRPTEDLGFTDDQDDTVDAPDSGLVGIVHPLQVAHDGFVAWGSLFGDYEITQPFAQLGREVFTLTEAEEAGSTIRRFDGMVVESTRLRGLAPRGWPLGAPQDGGIIGWLERRLRLRDGSTAEAHLWFEDGLGVEANYDRATQLLHTIDLHASGQYGPGKTLTFGNLDPLQASEILRALAPLAATAK